MEGELRLEEEEVEETFVSQEPIEEDEIGLEKIWEVRTNANKLCGCRIQKPFNCRSSEFAAYQT